MEEQINHQQRKIKEFQKWMQNVKLGDLQKTLADICEYNIGKFSGVIFEKEQDRIIIPIPPIMKPYISQKDFISVNEIKAYLITIYAFKNCLNAYQFGSITPEYSILGESLYSLLKQKLKGIIFSSDFIDINSCQSLGELINYIAKRFLARELPFGVNLQRESKPIEIVEKEDIIGLFIRSMSSDWSTKFIFSQGFLGVSVLALMQFTFNANRLNAILRWAIVIFGLITLSLFLTLFISSILGACRDLAAIDKIKSWYLKHIPEWLSKEAVQRLKQIVIPQYKEAVCPQRRKKKGESSVDMAATDKQFQIFLFEIRKGILMINPLLNEEQVLNLLLEGLEKAHSWNEWEEFLRDNSQEDVLVKIDQLVKGTQNMPKKFHQLRKIIRAMTYKMPESQVKQLIIEGVMEANNLLEFRTIVMNRMQELRLVKKITFVDRMASIFMFLD